MQISDEMVEAFGNAFWSVNAASKIDGQREHIRAALEAALSTDADPVAWLVKRYANDGSWLNNSVYLGKPHIGSTAKTEFIPLYAEPVKTAPDVAVKKIEPVWIKHDGKSIPVNAETVVEVRMADGFEHEENLAGSWLEREGSKSNWHHDLGCPHPCDIVAYRIVNGYPALSAQVQDVAVPALKIGIYGKAYDRPDERRAYTYDDQPNNVEAYKLGRVCSEVHSGGDFIDRGLNLLKALQREGFGVFELPASPASKHGDAE